MLFARALLAFVALPGMVSFLIPGYLALRTPVATGANLLGCVPLIVGTAGLLTCVRAFAVSGRGTLAAWAPPTRLVTGGLYRRTRNPMYVCALTIIAGWAMLAQSWGIGAYGLVVAAVFHLHVVYAEEPWAARTFGAEWEAYAREVPRWFGRRAPNRSGL